MKKILQTLDSDNKLSKPDIDNFKKLLSIVTENNAHGVSLPVQLTMQHYQQPVNNELINKKTSDTLSKYLKIIEDENINQTKQKHVKIAEQAKLIAKRVINKHVQEDVSLDKVDTVTMDIPLLIRILEYAREDAQSDVDLHDISERLIKLTKKYGTLSMKYYNFIVKNN